TEEHLSGVFHPCPEADHGVQTGADGRFVLDRVKPGLAAIDISAHGFLDARVEGLATRGGGPVDDLEGGLERGAVLTGRVIAPDGEPAAGARISALGDRGMATGRSDAEGSYRLDGVSLGSVLVLAEIAGFRNASMTMEITAGNNAQDMRFTEVQP